MIKACLEILKKKIGMSESMQLAVIWGCVIIAVFLIAGATISVCVYFSSLTDIEAIQNGYTQEYMKEKHGVYWVKPHSEEATKGEKRK